MSFFALLLVLHLMATGFAVFLVLDRRSGHRLGESLTWFPDWHPLAFLWRGRSKDNLRRDFALLEYYSMLAGTIAFVSALVILDITSLVLFLLGPEG